MTCGVDWMRVKIPEHARICKKEKGKGKGKKLSGSKENGNGGGKSPVKSSVKPQKRRPITKSKLKEIQDRYDFKLSERAKQQAYGLAVLREKRKEQKDLTEDEEEDEWAVQIQEVIQRSIREVHKSSQGRRSRRKRQSRRK